MIVLKANRELDFTFSRLIKTMGVPVEWTKYFVVIGDYLIIQGRVRSVFFNFESRKVITNVVDIPVNLQEVVEITDESKVCNVLNLVLYAFGKWGSIKGITVEKDYAQVNALFESVLREFHVEPGYSQINFRFFKDGIRINYEDVVQFALEATEEKIEEEKVPEEEARGLWHKLVWNKKTASFIKNDTTFEERQAGRIGKNFYMVGYQCPQCKENLHMVVFPEGREFKIETNEGRVLLARAYTCENCHCFYTPRPKKLLIEGDIYSMEFLNDERAYSDYLDLLGSSGDRVSNYNFNEFESEKTPGLSGNGEEALEELCDNIEDISREEIFRLENMMEEGFYPGESVKRLEDAVGWESRKRKGNLSSEEKAYSAAHPGEKMRSLKEKPGTPKQRPEDKQKEKQPEYRELKTPQRESLQPGDTGVQSRQPEAGELKSPGERSAGKKEEQKKEEQEKKGYLAKEATGNIQEGEPEEKELMPAATKATPAEQAAAKRRYDAKFGVLDRLSVSQIKELRQQLEREMKLSVEDKSAYLLRLEEKEDEKRISHARQRAKEGSLSSNYGQIQKIIREIEEEKLPGEQKSQMLEPLYARRKEQADAEVSKLMSSRPKVLDRAGFEKLQKKLNSYPEADLSIYEKQLDEAKSQVEENEISNMVRRARTGSRRDLSDLVQRLQSHGFSQDLLKPYLDKVNNRIRQMDEEAIDSICHNPMKMTEDEVTNAYRKIQEGLFLPELKTHALEMLNKRLVKIKTDECELLVDKLQSSMTEKMKNNPRHHFYPARKVMMKEASLQETQEIQYALETYAGTRGKFEYPILVVDTSRNESGREGMILTPEHLFYHAGMNAYEIPIGDVRGVKASTGILNSGLFIELKGGSKTKIPYAVDRQELKVWAGILRDFIMYLQERPNSRKVDYLAKEKHETICCFRCGYTYKGGDVCPKCGYKMNQ